MADGTLPSFVKEFNTSSMETGREHTYKEMCNNKRNSLDVQSSEESLRTDGWFLHRLNAGEKMVIGLPPVTVIGSQNCKSRLVSPQHVSISILNNEQLYVRDLETRYGTFVNDQRISSNGTIMKEWDILCLGCKRPRNGTEFGFVLRLKDSTVLNTTRDESVDSLANSTDLKEGPRENTENALLTEIKQEADEKLVLHPVVCLERLPLIERLARLCKNLSSDSDKKTDSTEDSDMSQITDYVGSDATTVSLNRRKSSVESVQSSDASVATIPSRRANGTAAKVKNNCENEKTGVRPVRTKVSRKKVETWLSNETSSIKSLQNNEQEILKEDNAVASSESMLSSNESSQHSNQPKHRRSNIDSDSECSENDSDYECKVSDATLSAEESISSSSTLVGDDRTTIRDRKMKSNNLIATSSSDSTSESSDDSVQKFPAHSLRTTLGKRAAYYWGPSRRQSNRQKKQNSHRTIERLRIKREKRIRLSSIDKDV